MTHFFFNEAADFMQWISSGIDCPTTRQTVLFIAAPVDISAGSVCLVTIRSVDSRTS